MSVKDEQKERSHQTILHSAARLLHDRGIAGARVADVMQGAGMTVGGFYAHFASKTALINETFRRTGERLRAHLFGGLDKKPAADRAVVVLKRYLSAAHRDQQEDGCSLPAVVGEIGTTAPEFNAALAEQIEALTAGLAAHLEGDERRQHALGLCALMVGGLSLSRALRGTDLSDEVLKACRSLGIDAVRRRF